MAILRRNFLQRLLAGGAGIVLGGDGIAAAAVGSRPRQALLQGGIAPDPVIEKPAPVSMAELAGMKIEGVRAVEVNDYVFGNYRGPLTPSPPHADFNPKKALMVVWEGKPYKFVFWHEASYSPFFLLPSGVGADFQFWESNFGGELFNQYGRMERNSYVDIIESGPQRVWLRWTYFDTDMRGDPPVIRGTDDFVSYPNGVIWRRQTYRSFYPNRPTAQCASPLDFFAAIPAGMPYWEVLPEDKHHGDFQVGAFVDAYSDKQYNLYWNKSDKLSWTGPYYTRRTGAEWFLDIERSRGKAAVQTFRDGLAYCTLGDSGGYLANRTQLWDNSHPDTSPCNWGNVKMIHWPIGWLTGALQKARGKMGVLASFKDIMTYPYHISGLSMCFVPNPFPMSAEARSWPNIRKAWSRKEQERWVEGRVFYCLHGVGEDFATVRNVSRKWLDKGAACARPESVEDL